MWFSIGALQLRSFITLAEELHFGANTGSSTPPVQPPPAQASAPQSSAPAASRPRVPGEAPGVVSVNRTSKVFHCSGTRSHGTTKVGKYHSEAEGIG